MRWSIFSGLVRQTTKKLTNLSLAIILSLSGLVAAVPLLFSGSAAAATPVVAASPPPCDVVGTPFLNITQNITNDPDSGVYSDWAVDAFTEHVSVWLGTDNSTYCANAYTDNGTFVTNGTVSPEQGNPLPQTVTGTFTGGENYTLPSSLVLNPDYNTDSVQTIPLPASSTAGFSWWVNNVFPSVDTSQGSSYVNTYSLTYIASNGSSWTDADNVSGGDVGDIYPVFDVTSGIGYSDIQSAVNAANPGDTINVANGTYTLASTLYINKALTLSGTTESGTIIDASGVAAGYGVSTDADGVTIENLTINGPTNATGYGLKIEGSAPRSLAADSNININNVTVNGSYRSGIDLNGINNASLTNVTSTGVTHGNGVAVTDSHNVTINGVSVNNDAWGGIALYASGTYYACGIDGFTLEGTNNFGNESLPLYTGVDNLANPACTLTNLTIPSSALPYEVTLSPGDPQTGYFTSLAQAGVVAGTNVVRSTSDNTQVWVAPGQTIQNAIDGANPGDTVNVSAGTYNENLTINKAVTLLGPNDGIDPNTNTPSTPATINGGDGFAISLESPSVAISGFTITANSDGEGIYNIDADTSGHDIGGLNVTDNIFSGSSRAVALESNAPTGTVTISHNKFSSTEKDVAVADNSFNNLVINNNVFNQPTNNDGGPVQIGPDGTSTISAFQFEGNTVNGNVNVGANVENAMVSGNTFNAGLEAGGDVEFQAALHNGSTVSNNTFNGGQAYACLQLFGSQYGLTASDGVTISGNHLYDCGDVSSPYYNYGFQLSQDVSNVTFTGNTIDNAYDGINTRFFSGSAWTIGSGISITNNQITNSRHLAVNNTVTGTLNVAQNWFGSASNPSADVSSSVTYTPWCAQAGCSSYLSDQNLSLTPSGGIATSSSTGSTTVNGSGAVSSVTATIPANTTITSSNSGWDGVVAAPAVASYTVPGNNTTYLAISVGSDDGSSLTFNQPVELVLADQAGKSVGFVKNGVFTAITQACSGTPTIGDLNALDPVGACYIANDGSGNLIVWTDHFTTFVAYSQSPTPSSPSTASSSSTTGNTGSSTASSSTTPAVQGSSTTPEVLGNNTNPQTLSSNTGRPSTVVAATAPAGGKILGLQWYWWLVILAVVASAYVAYAYAISEKE